jgi:hypothetical protein
MNRRAFLSAVTGGLLAAPLAAEAQEAIKVARIGFLAGNLAALPWSCPGFVDGARLARYATTGWRCS